MKTFDYRDSMIKDVALLVGGTVNVWKQLVLFPTYQDYIAQHSASCGYIAIMTRDDDAVLHSRDLVKVARQGQIRLLFDVDARIAFNWWQDSELAFWYHSEPGLWHVVRNTTRKQRQYW